MADTICYNITKSDGTPVTIDENEIDYSQFSIGLIGHGKLDYGATQNQNFVQMLENFANSKEPKNPISGQLWYDKTENVLKVCKDASSSPIEWIPILNKNNPNSETPPENVTTGDIWFNKENGTLEVYQGGTTPGEEGKWIVIGPVSTEDVERSDEYNDISSVSPKSEFTVKKIKFDSYGLYLVKINILATEYSEVNDNNYVDKDDRFCCWCYKAVIRKYKDNISDKIDILGEPSYELLTSSPDINWKIHIRYDNSLGNSGLIIELDKNTSGGNNINVVYDVEVIKNKIKNEEDPYNYGEES